MNQPGIAKRLRSYLSSGRPMAEKLSEYINRSDLQESSIEVLVRSVVFFDEELFVGICPKDVGYGHVDDYRSWLKKGRAGSTANTYLAMIGGFFGWMHSRGYIQTDPFDRVKKFIVERKKYSLFTEEEIGRIFRVADLAWKTIVSLALCSMRRTDILNLTVSDIDFENNEIHIRPKGKSETTWPWSIKNHQEALVGIDETVAQMLIRMIDSLEDKRQPYVVLKKFYWQRNLKLQAEGKLTHSLRNCPWGNFSRDFSKLLIRARVPHRRFHDNRVKFATERYEEGYDLIDLQYLMRHASTQTTAMYINKVEERKLIKQSGRTFKKFYGTKVS